MSTTSDLYDELQELNDRQQNEDQTDPLDEIDEARLTALDELFQTIDEDTYLIKESEFEDYARELAEELSDLGSLSMYIDWSHYAADMVADYSVVEFEGDTYYFRAS